MYFHSDNIHAHAEHLPEELVSSIVAAYPRPGWGGCFAGAMQNEVDAKPWSHATEIRESEAWGKILTNDLAKAD
jgi:cyanamide hydratase